MKTKYSILLLLSLLITLPVSGFAQFGKNKVQYKEPEWVQLQSKYFDILFYEGGKYIAEFAADILDSALEKFQKEFDYNIRKRIPVVIYKSHNDFQQTNVIIPYMEEGIGGVTESFKNRVVVPFEGSYEQFRHVLVHELTHAFLNDLIYGGSVQSIVSGAVRLQLPPWFAEGTAEYFSLDWDTRADMILRDGTIYGYLDRMSPYQKGQALFRYIADKYGREKVPDIVRKVNITKDVERGIMSALGIDLEELAKQFELAMKRKYWPDIADRQNPEEFATRLTNHIEDKNFMNVGGTISPNGDKIVFLTDKDGYFDLFLISAINGEVIGKLLSGQRSPALEELKFLTPGISWSPDGKFVALSVKAGDQDALTLIDVKTKKFKQKKFGLDGIFDADWSPNGDEIAFTGLKDGASDIYAYNTKTDKIRRITDDYFSDKLPSWSPDGSRILFVSDRKEYTDVVENNQDYGGANGGGDNNPPYFRMQGHDFKATDVYVMDANGANIERLTFDPADDGFPVWAPDGDKIAYTSEANGISNIYIMDMATRYSYPITNALTGCFQLSWSKEGSKLVFTSFYEGGYDIYMIKNPLNKESLAGKLQNTVFFDQLAKGAAAKVQVEEANLAERLVKEAQEKSSKMDLSQFIFDDRARKYVKENQRGNESLQLNPSEYKEPDGSYKVKKYKLKFTPDIVTGNYGYDTFFGVQGSSIIQFSDMLGNHTVLIMADLYFDLRNSNYSLAYFHLPRKTDYGIGIYNQVNFFSTLVSDRGYFYYLPVRLRNYGVNLMASRPFSKYSRVDFGVAAQQVSQEFMDPGYAVFDNTQAVYRASMNLVRDTAYWGFLGPIDGIRGNLMMAYSPPVGNKYNRISYFTMMGDYRKYLRIKRDYSFALRLTGGFSEGETPERFFLGGVPNWINRKFRGDIRTGLNDIFFSYWIDPLRGSPYYELIGTRFALMNAELRFPFIRAIVLGWPLPATFQDIRGALFTDIGAAWDDDNFKQFSRNSSGQKTLEDMRLGFGTGIRVYFGGYFLVRLDIAWNYDYIGISKPLYYVSIGGNW